MKAKVDKSGRTSAGILLWRRPEGRLEVLLAHNGGPYWVKKDHGHWTVLKGEAEPGEELEAVARREFAEETGTDPPQGATVDLGEVRQPSGKRITAWAVEGDFDAAAVKSNTFTMEWPPRSGRHQEFPEIDRADWFDTATARVKLVNGQVPFIDVLEDRVLGARA